MESVQKSLMWKRSLRVPLIMISEDAVERFHCWILGVSQKGGPRDDDGRKRRRFRMKREDWKLVVGSRRLVLEMKERNCDSCVSDRLCRRVIWAEELRVWLVANDSDNFKTSVLKPSIFVCIAWCSEPCLCNSL